MLSMMIPLVPPVAVNTFTAAITPMFFHFTEPSLVMPPLVVDQAGIAVPEVPAVITCCRFPFVSRAIWLVAYVLLDCHAVATKFIMHPAPEHPAGDAPVFTLPYTQSAGPPVAFGL